METGERVPEGRAAEYLTIRTAMRPTSWFNNEIVFNLSLLLKGESSVWKKDEVKGLWVNNRSSPSACQRQLTPNEQTVRELATPRGTRVISSGMPPLSLKSGKRSRETSAFLSSNR